MSRISRLTNGGLTHIDLSWNPAGQILTRTLSGNLYAFDNHVAVNRTYGINNLNQYT